MSEPRDNPLTDGVCFPLVLGITVGERVQVKIYNKNNNNYSKVLEKESKTITWPHSVHSLRAVSSLLIVAVFISMRGRK